MQALKESKPPVSAFWIVNDNHSRELLKNYYRLPETTIFEIHDHYHCKFCDE